MTAVRCVKGRASRSISAFTSAIRDGIRRRKDAATSRDYPWKLRVKAARRARKRARRKEGYPHFAVGMAVLILNTKPHFVVATGRVSWSYNPYFAVVARANPRYVARSARVLEFVHESG